MEIKYVNAAIVKDGFCYKTIIVFSSKIIAVKRSEAAHNSMTPTLFCLKIKKMPNFDMYHVVIMHNVLLLKVSMV